MNREQVNIHPLAVVDDQAIIGVGTVVQAFAVVEADVQVGSDCTIMSHAVVKNGTRMGDACTIFHGAVVGADPQDLKYAGESTFVKLGDRVVVREYCTLNRGTAANTDTIIGDDTLLMAYVHVAHDCIIGHHCILANAVTLAGHVEIGHYVTIGGMSAVQQFVKIGDHVYLGGACKVRKDVPPFIKAAREPLKYIGVNKIGLQRRGFTDERIDNIRKFYENLDEDFEYNGLTQESQMDKEHIEAFAKKSKFGIVR